MSYKVLIKKCSDPLTAMHIANAIARWSGAPANTVYTALTTKTICIRKCTNDGEALRLKEQFESLGAEVELVTIEGETSSLHSTAAPVNHQTQDDDDDDPPGRLLSDEEYTQRMREREDIFYLDRNKRLKNNELVCMVLAILVGIFLSTREITKISLDFIEAGHPPIKEITVNVTEVKRPTFQDEVKPPQKKEIVIDRKSLKEHKNRGSGGRTGGGGNPYARATKMGLLGLIAEEIKGKPLENADIFGKGGFASNIDAILQGMNGLKTGGGGGVGRRGVNAIGFGTGYGSGFGGGSSSDGIDNLFNSGENGGTLVLKRRKGTLRISPPVFTKGASLTSGRSKQGIARVVMQNISALRYAYNQRLRQKPGLKGRITVKFAIDEFGNVIFCALEESTMSDNELESIVLSKIRLWKFEKIDKVGDVTEVVYPFVFSQ